MQENPFWRQIELEHNGVAKTMAVNKLSSLEKKIVLAYSCTILGEVPGVKVRGATADTFTLAGMQVHHKHMRMR